MLKTHVMIAALASAGNAGCSMASDTFDVGAMQITEFRDGRQAAASYTFDDGPNSSFSIAEMFEAHGMRASFNVVSSYVTTDSAWAQWRSLVERGHEVGNHSQSHIDLSDPTLSDQNLSVEIEGAQQTLAQKLGVMPRVFVFPYHLASERAASIALRSHIATRTPGLPFDGARYRVVGFGAQSTTSEVNAILDEVIRSRGWFVAAGHGIDGDGWNPISSQFLEAHLQFVQARSSEVWVGTFRDVALYTLARAQAQPKASIISKSAIRVAISGVSGSWLSSVPLTLEVPLLRAVQGIRAQDAQGRDVPITAVNGAIRLTFSGEQEIVLEITSSE